MKVIEFRKVSFNYFIKFSVKSILRDTINIQVSPDMKPPNEIQAKLIRQVVLCGFFDHIAR